MFNFDQAACDPLASNVTASSEPQKSEFGFVVCVAWCSRESFIDAVTSCAPPNTWWDFGASAEGDTSLFSLDGAPPRESLLAGSDLKKNS
jgi:hypothetical protein